MVKTSNEFQSKNGDRIPPVQNATPISARTEVSMNQIMQEQKLVNYMQEQIQDVRVIWIHAEV